MTGTIGVERRAPGDPDVAFDDRFLTFFSFPSAQRPTPSASEI
jgi:hypothetical protein